MKQPLSVVIITQNEEKNLRDCLASVCDLADEIVVFNNSIAGQTRIIAREFGAVIQVTNDWPGFGAQKSSFA